VPSHEAVDPAGDAGAELLEGLQRPAAVILILDPGSEDVAQALFEKLWA
jgi:hypothetical protein